MIPAAYITEWRSHAPLTQNAWVEQDLIISRALVEIFGAGGPADSLAFRGGTALYKLYLTPAARYSEDIDLVRTRGDPRTAVPTLPAPRFAHLGAPRVPPGRHAMDFTDVALMALQVFHR